MSEINVAVDALGLFLNGGASNRDPDLSLGGVASSTRIRGLGAIVDRPIPAIRIDNVYPACGEGTATLAVDASGDLVFTPPGDSAGTPVSIVAGESKVLSGADTTKAIRVFRESGLAFPSNTTSTLTFVNALNGVMSMANVTNAQRLAGVTTYRSFMLFAQGAIGVGAFRLWTPSVGGSQAAYELGFEVPVGNAIQTIADELTAPAGVAFASHTTELGALTPPPIGSGVYMGVWLKRIFPVGTVALKEDFQLAMKFNVT